MDEVFFIFLFKKKKSKSIRVIKIYPCFASKNMEYNNYGYNWISKLSFFDNLYVNFDEFYINCDTPSVS